MEAYCVKCKAKSDMKNPKVVRTKKGGYMAKGSCAKCDTTMCRMMSKEQAEEMEK